MQRTVWEIGIGGALLLLVGMSVDCVFEVGGLPSSDQNNSYTCACDCESVTPTGPVQSTTKLNVCVRSDQNPNTNPNTNPPTLTDLNADCSNRVLNAFVAITNTCGGLAQFTCTKCTAESPKVEPGCDGPKRDGTKPCDPVLLKGDCSNFDSTNIFGKPGSGNATLPQNPASDAAPVCTVPPGQ